MAAINATPTIRDKTAKSAIFYYRGVAGAGLSISNADTLQTGMKRVLEVRTNKPAAITGWSSVAGLITFTVTGGAQTGVLVTVVGQA